MRHARLTAGKAGRFTYSEAKAGAYVARSLCYLVRDTGWPVRRSSALADEEGKPMLLSLTLVWEGFVQPGKRETVSWAVGRSRINFFVSADN
jgi:hypothetical protein